MRLLLTIWLLCVSVMLCGNVGASNPDAIAVAANRQTSTQVRVSPSYSLDVPQELRPSLSASDAKTRAMWRVELKANLKNMQVKPSLNERIGRAILKAVHNVIDPVIVAIGRWLEHGKLSRGPFGAVFYILAALFKIIGWLVVVAVICLLVYLLLRVVMMIAERVGLRSDVIAQSRPASQTVKPKRTEQEFLAAAEMEAVSGNYRDAVRYAYLAALMLMDSVGLVQYADDATNWEYIRRLRKAGSETARSAFEPMTVAFDHMIYGKSSVSDGDYRHCVDRYRELRKAIS